MSCKFSITTDEKNEKIPVISGHFWFIFKNDSVDANGYVRCEMVKYCCKSLVTALPTMHTDKPITCVR